MPKQAYYAARAIAERRQSQAATDPRAAAVHAEMSARYAALASDPGLELPTDGLPRFELPAHEAPTDLLASAEGQAFRNPTNHAAPDSPVGVVTGVSGAEEARTAAT